MTVFITALTVVVLAEMGDKTQLLAMAFAGKYSWKTVMAGVFVATVLNHFLAVIVGVYLGTSIDAGNIRIAASIAFIVFGLWTIRGDKLEKDSTADSRHGPFWTVVITFFLAEMGDKTQFATITLAAQYSSILPVLAGTTTGMMIADGVGILAGSLVNKKIPQKAMKWIAALIFIAFGVVGLYEELHG